jgi:CRP/FNR family transcriptional regulator
MDHDEQAVQLSQKSSAREHTKQCQTSPHRTHCQDCSLAALCLPSLDDNGTATEIVKRSRPFKRGEYLYRQGDEFSCVFAVCSGALKTFGLSDNGEELITGFHLPSELVGLSGMGSNIYPVSALALEETLVCRIPLKQLDEQPLQLPHLRRRLMRCMSRELRDNQQMRLLLSKKNADERIAAFLIDLSARFRSRDLPANQFRLPMSRNEIGSYLGLAVETVSRIFTRFQQMRLIASEGKEVHILAPLELSTLAGWHLDGSPI